MGKHKMVKMWSKDPTHQFAWDGESYKTDANGFVEVPGVAVDELIHHGLETLGMKANRERREEAERAELAAKHVSKPTESVNKDVLAQLTEAQKTIAAMAAKMDAMGDELASLKAPAKDKPKK